MEVNKDTWDIPGPIDWETASHWIRYDNQNFTVETWCKFGPDYRIRLRTRVRPMVGSEIIYAKLEGHSREEILKAYGIEENILRPSVTKPSKYRSFVNKLFNKKN